MIRHREFKGFFIMKKDEGGEWEYLSYYWRRGDNVKLKFSPSERKMFSDNTIESGLAWDVFSMVRTEFPESKVILYAEIKGQMVRVKYYNPSSEKRITSWFTKSDFYAYMPVKAHY